MAVTFALPNNKICKQWKVIQILSGEAMTNSKSSHVAFFLCLFFGYFGAHRFYLGKTGTGILWLCSLGLCGIGWIADLVILGKQAFKPKGYTKKNSRNGRNKTQQS